MFSYILCCDVYLIFAESKSVPGGWVLGHARGVGRLALAKGVSSADDTLALTPGATAAHAVVLLGASALRWGPTANI